MSNTGWSSKLGFGRSDTAKPSAEEGWSWLDLLKTRFRSIKACRPCVLGATWLKSVQRLVTCSVDLCWTLWRWVIHNNLYFAFENVLLYFIWWNEYPLTIVINISSRKDDRYILNLAKRDWKTSLLIFLLFVSILVNWHLLAWIRRSCIFLCLLYYFVKLSPGNKKMRQVKYNGFASRYACSIYRHV